MSDSAYLCRLPGGWPADAPPRSMLFTCEPLGKTAADVEDLASYFRRLCGLHGILPWSIALRIVAECGEKRSWSDRNKFADTCYDLRMDGADQIASVWSERLNQLTLRDDLQQRTLLPLRSILPNYKLLSPVERFCPYCYLADERANHPVYNRLLWVVDCVKACPLHKVELQPAPRPCAAAKEPFWLPGVSRVDGRSLSSWEPVAASTEEVRLARLSADLFDDFNRNPTSFPDRNGSIQFLRRASLELFDGVSAHFAEHLGVSKSELHGWASGKVRPSLPRLALIAYCCGCRISDVLRGTDATTKRKEGPSRSPSLTVRVRMGGRKPKAVLIAELGRLVGSGAVTNVSEAAAKLQVSVKYLRKLSPHTSAQLVELGREMRYRAVRERDENKFAEFVRTFRALTVDGKYPSRRTIETNVFQRTGIIFHFDQTRKYMRQARELAAAQTPKHGNDEQTSGTS